MSYTYKVSINNVDYNMHDLQSVSIEQPLFEKVGIGGTCSAKLEMVLWPKGEIPRAADVQPYVQIDGEWQTLGKFIISQRWDVNEAVKIIAYDYMLKSEQMWTPDQSLEFPLSQKTAVALIAKFMGVGIDSRTEINESYTVEYPVDVSLRDVLQFIAISHAGNWIITRNNELLLVPLAKGLPPETWYLIEEHGDAILFGDDRIVVR